MPFDFYDIDEILMEEKEVTCRVIHDIKGGGILDPDVGARSQDLRAGAKVQLPFCIAQGLVQRGAATLELPKIFGQTVQEDLERDPVVCNLVNMSEYYFEFGTRVASLLKNEALAKSIQHALTERWSEVVTQLGRVGVTKQHTSPLNPGGSFFPVTLTVPEQAMLNGGKEAEKHFKKWMDRFAVSCIETSSIVEAPSKRLRTR